MVKTPPHLVTLVLQRRAYGYRDEDYLKLKIVAVFPGSVMNFDRIFCFGDSITLGCNDSEGIGWPGQA